MSVAMGFVPNESNLRHSIFGMVQRKRSVQFANKSLAKRCIGDVHVIAPLENLHHSVASEFIERLFE